MESRKRDLNELSSYIECMNKEITMILQSLQWDRKHLLETKLLSACKYDAGHRVYGEKKDRHERECLLKHQGYTREDTLLPEPLDSDTPAVVTFNTEQIKQIINNAAQGDALFKRGPGPTEMAPLSAGRLQVAYTPDERRALHDAVVAAAPALPEITDFVLPGSSNEDATRPKSKLEVLAELRNMHRRRAKYRGPSAASKNYSHVLRELIKTQMECYGGSNDVQPTKLDKPHTTHTQQRDKNYDNRDTTTQGSTVEIKTEPLDEYTSEKYKENKNHKIRKDYNEYREKDRYRGRHNYCDDKNRERYDKYNRKDYKSTREEDRYLSSRDEKEKHRVKIESERRSEYSRHSSRYDKDDRNDKSYKKEKHNRSSRDSREKSRHRDRDEFSRDRETNSDQTYKRYYETRSESDASYKNTKRKRHS